MLEMLSVNYHLCTKCNMGCRYCFARLSPPVGATKRGSLVEKDALALTRIVASRVGKVTFVGGEPTLVPFLPRLIRAAKECGATTMLVTNGSLLTSDAVRVLAPSLDWLGLSIDSALPATHSLLGRQVRGRPLSVQHYLRLAESAHRFGMGLKVNTVVTAANHLEDMSGLVRLLGPDRWKVFQVLEVDGQNGGQLAELSVTGSQFHAFVCRHRRLLGDGFPLVAEDNQAMTGSYLMVDPMGRLFDNVTGAYLTSQPILEVGFDAALAQIRFCRQKYEERGGGYDWLRPLLTSHVNGLGEA